MNRRGFLSIKNLYKNHQNFRNLGFATNYENGNSQEKYHQFYTIALASSLFGGALSIYSNEQKQMAKVMAKVMAKEAEIDSSEPPKPEPVKEPPKKFKQKRMMEYENKIRMHSNPDKVFRYFATVAAVYEDNRSHDVYMTPDDFIRSLTPGGELQPDNLLLDQYKKIRTEKSWNKALKMPRKELAKFPETFAAFGGYINYEDYMFLLMLLTTPRRNFEIAFRMFDLDGNGVVDAQEFEKVSETIMKGTMVGKRHTNKKRSNIATYFFGDDRKKTLTSDEFVNFQKYLQRDILKMEFNLLNPDENNIIKEKDFANMLLIHARFDADKTKKTRKRINKMFKRKKIKSENEDGEEVITFEEQPDEGINFEQVHNFYNFIKNIHDVEIAFTFFAMAGKEIDGDTLKQVAKSVCGIELTDRVVKILFTIFDEDGNGTLTHKEFIDVMKKRLLRGLDSKRELGFVNKFSALSTCAYEAYAPAPVKSFVDTVIEGGQKAQPEDTVEDKNFFR